MRYRGLRLAAILAGIWAIWAGALVVKRGLFVATHEGDTVHLVEIVLRQAAGQWPHLDYMTPIGVLATGPIAAFVAAGWTVGGAVLWAQALVALVLLPALWWVGVSRMGEVWAALFGAVAIILVCALVHGEAKPALSISMHYNRWAWAVAFVALALAVLPPVRRQSAVADGLIYGLALACLALIKVTYAVAVIPVVLLALAARRDGRAFVVAVGAGLAVMAVVTVWAGLGFWSAYIADLRAVQASVIRGAPGADIVSVIVAPAYLGGSLVALLAVILLRRAGRAEAGLLLLVATPGVFFITYQNYGNDPQWLYLFGILLLVLRPEDKPQKGPDLRQALALAGCAAFTLGLPSLLNLMSSPFRHLIEDPAAYEALLPQTDQARDVQFREFSKGRVTGITPLPGFPDTGLKPAVLNGEALAVCQLHAGTIGLSSAIADRLEIAGHAGRTILTADLFNAVWMFTDADPLPGGAPWYYGGLPGGEAAELLLVPRCPVLPYAQRVMLQAAERAGWVLTEIERDPLYILLDIQRP